MFQKLPKILIYFFLIVFILQLISLIFLLVLPQESQAITFTPQIDIGVSGEVGPKTIGLYIQAIYKYAIGMVGILAAVVMMFGGILWLMAGGNQERISNAKSWITASITGLVLALSSYMILNTVNPDLVNLQPINPEPPYSGFGGGGSGGHGTSGSFADPEGCCTTNIYGAYPGCKIVKNSECTTSNATTWWGSSGEMIFKIGGTCHGYGSPNYNPCETYEFGCCLYDWNGKDEYDDCDNNITKNNCDQKSGQTSWEREKNCKDYGGFWNDDYKCE